ncbi:MAG: hypothetical protein HFI95_04880 [Lachnospiraceae bacterium]|nr:hypothetical protein [Lachnospiraceae bacterium]
MEQMLIRVLNMSLTAGIVILAVMSARLMLRRAPKIFSYVLWLAVLFRLLCPLSFSLDFSLLGMLKAPLPQRGQMQYIPENIGLMRRPEISLPGDIVTDIVNSSLPAGMPEASMNPMQGILFAGAVIWLAGVLTMIVYSMVSYGKLRMRLRGVAAEEEAGRIYRTECVETAFVCGLFCPRIYLPLALGEEEKAYILLHEQIHIRRGDQIWRALSYLALCIHWFNPLVWIAFYLSGKDMEMSCDEAVIRKMGSGVRKDYSASLLSLACGRRVMPGLPLAFGEGQTGSRIKNLLHYKRVGKSVALLLGAVCLLASALLAANPGKGGQPGYRDGLSCYDIPLGEGRLFWGMSREELTAVMGEPSAEEVSEAGTTMTYDISKDGALMDTELGGGSQAIFYVGDHNLTDPEDRGGEKLSSGLCGIMMTLSPTTKERILDRLSDFYGELSPSGGGTSMEMQLRQANPGYFNETHFCEAWRIGNLPDEEYERLTAVFRANEEDRPIDGENLLMYIYIWGVEEGDSYPCVVQLDVSMMGTLAYLTQGRDS